MSSRTATAPAPLRFFEKVGAKAFLRSTSNQFSWRFPGPLSTFPTNILSLRVTLNPLTTHQTVRVFLRQTRLVFHGSAVCSASETQFGTADPKEKKKPFFYFSLPPFFPGITCSGQTCRRKIGHRFFLAENLSFRRRVRFCRQGRNRAGNELERKGDRPHWTLLWRVRTRLVRRPEPIRPRPTILPANAMVARRETESE